MDDFLREMEKNLGAERTGGEGAEGSVPKESQDEWGSEIPEENEEMGGKDYNYEEDLDQSRTGGFTFRARAMVCDHKNNARVALYPVPEEIAEKFGPETFGGVCCFSLKQIEARLESMKRCGQITPIDFYRTGTGGAVVVKGHLRHAAMLLAEARNIEIPGISNWKIKAQKVSTPKTGADREATFDATVAENLDAVPLSYVDLGHTANMYMLQGWKIEQVAERLGVQVQIVRKYLRLRAAPLDIQLAVHEGRMRLGEAMTELSRKGEAGGRGQSGAQSGVKKSELAAAMASFEKAQEAPSAFLNVDELAIVEYFLGKREECPERLAAFLAHAGELKEANKGKGGRKKAESKPTEAPKKRGRPKKAKTEEPKQEPESTTAEEPKPVVLAPLKKGHKGKKGDLAPAALMN